MSNDRSHVAVALHPKTIEILQSVLDTLEEQGVTEDRVREKAMNYAMNRDEWSRVAKTALVERSRWEERGHVEYVYRRTCLLRANGERMSPLVERLWSWTRKRFNPLKSFEIDVDLGITTRVERGVEYAIVDHFIVR